MIDWIFFDIGSTLVDESECEEYRFRKTIEGSDISFSSFIEEYINLCKQNLPAYNIMIKKYNLPHIPWPSFKEKPIKNIEIILEAKSLGLPSSSMQWSRSMQATLLAMITPIDFFSCSLASKISALVNQY